MKFDVNVLRYLDKDTWRVLVATEMGMKNHEIVPVQLINAIAGLKRGGGFKHIKELLKHKLVHHENKEYDGYRLTPLGYDFLALKSFVNRGVISGVGRKIGVGKESDVYEVIDGDGRRMALKLHRLGRTSFRDVKSKRDYLGKRTQYNWLYLSRLAALKEHQFMVALHEYGFPVPEPIDLNRHAVLMSVIRGAPLRQIRNPERTGDIYRDCMQNIVRLAKHGLVHCDYNEFNLMLDDKQRLVIIDFPQMISTNHPNAEELFWRDVKCLHKFFLRHWDYRAEDDPLGEPDPDFKEITSCIDPSQAIDVQLRASGFTRNQVQQLEEYTQEIHEKGRGSDESDQDFDSEDDSEEEEEDEDEEEEEEIDEEDAEQYDMKLNDDEIAELAAQVQAAMNDEDDFNRRGTYDEEVVPMQKFNHRKYDEPSVSGSESSGDKRPKSPAAPQTKAELRKERKEAERRLKMETASMLSVDPAAAAEAIRQRLKLEKRRKSARNSNYVPKVNHSKEKHGRGHKEKITKAVDSFWG